MSLTITKNYTILIFDLEVGGHHPGYLRHLLRYWSDINVHLIFVVSPAFAERHKDVVATETEAEVTWKPITQHEIGWYTASRRSLIRRAWIEWQLYYRYAQKLQPDQGLIMYIDRFQLPMALRFPLPCSTSGIFFRPKFHYQQFVDHPWTCGEQLRVWREQWLWCSALCHTQLKTLFSLDPLAVEPLRTLGGNTQIIPLPDPVEFDVQPSDAIIELRQELGLDPARKVLLLFGVIDQRKGIYQVLEALQQLTAAQQAKLTLLLVGRLAEADRATVLASIAALQQNSSLQIIIQDRFVHDKEIQRYFAVADIILALYQRHVGSSGILLQAAAAGKPVLASNYGLMGELVRQHQLGAVIDSTNSAQIAEAMRKFLKGDPIQSFDCESATQFAQTNSVQRFTEVIWTNISSPQSVSHVAQSQVVR